MLQILINHLQYNNIGFRELCFLLIKVYYILKINLEIVEFQLKEI